MHAGARKCTQARASARRPKPMEILTKPMGILTEPMGILTKPMRILTQPYDKHQKPNETKQATKTNNWASPNMNSLFINSDT